MLVPTKYTQDVLPSWPEADYFTVGESVLVVECGYYVDWVSREEILIEKITQSLTQYGNVLHREEEHWTYERLGAPPLGFTRRVYGRPYLPEVNPGRKYMLLEEEIAEFYPWTGFQSGVVNLSRLTRWNGWVVYDANWDHMALEADEKKKLEEEGIRPDGAPHLVVDSARTWSEAISESSIVKAPGALQVTKWRKPFKTQTELVFEYPDRFDVYDITHVRIRPGPPVIEGPRVQRKELYAYRLPVPIDPPKIRARASDGAVLVEAEGGGATVNERRIHPTSYRFLRRKISEPARDPSGDLYDLWQDDPAPVGRRRILAVAGTTDLGGAPASPLPTQVPYTEPGDTSEPEAEGWAVIGEAPNAKPSTEPGYAAITDEDLVSGATYEYQATALVNTEESPPSRPVSVEYGGATSASSIPVRVTRTDDGVLEVDVLAPEDPQVLPDDYGEIAIFDLPLDVDLEEAEDLGLEIATRQFLEHQDAALRLKVDTTVPILGLERGQLVRPPLIEAKLTGNGLVIDLETQTDAWVLESYRRQVRRNGDRLVDFGTTSLTLREL